VSKLHTLAAVATGTKRAPDIIFLVRENRNGQCFLDRLSLGHRVLHRDTGGEVPATGSTTAPKPAVKPLYIFVGGFADRDTYHPVANYVESFRGAHPDSDVRYFPWDDCDGLLNTIRSAPSGAKVNVVGHSYGADTAAYCIGYMAPTGIHVDKLITIDPVGRTPIPDGWRSGASTWINVAANPSVPNGSDTVAAWGGKGGRLPTEQADANYKLDTNHAEFTTMMKTPGPGGLSPEQMLLSDGPPSSVPSPGDPSEGTSGSR
jgi:pimeloyl-ACP methyl ester carboxylesterase